MNLHQRIIDLSTAALYLGRGCGRWFELPRGRHRGLVLNSLCDGLSRAMREQPPTVFVLDDDLSIRDAVRSLIRSVGLNVEFFGSPFEFLQRMRPDIPGCLVLDVRLPGKSGLDLQRELAENDIPLPLIFLTAHGDIPMTVRAIKAGAVEFLTKPFRDQDLLDAIQTALERDRATRQRKTESAMLRGRFDLLTPREREVLPLLVSGLANKQIAAEIGTTEATVKVHRSQLMKKMGADSLPELVRMADKIGIPGSSDKVQAINLG